METRICPKCNQAKTIDHFYKGKRRSCKECVKAYENSRRAKDPEKYKERNRERAKRYRTKYPEKTRKAVNDYKARDPDKWKRYRADWEKSHPGSASERGAQWRKRNFPQRRDYELRSEYGIDLNTYHQMFDEQSGCCAICGKHQDVLTKTLSVDHSHTTGQVRRLLCHKCNMAIGLLDDSPELAAKVSQYLTEYLNN